MFYVMSVHYIFSSVWGAEWPPFWEIAARSVGHFFSLSFCHTYLFPVLVKGGLLPTIGRFLLPVFILLNNS